MDLAFRRERAGEHLLRAGLADAAGDRGDLRAAAGTRRAAEIGERADHVVDDDQRPLDLAKAGEAVLGDDRHAGAAGERLGDEIVAVETVALDCKERIAQRERPAVDRNAGDCLRLYAERPASDRNEECIERPEGLAHAASSAARMTPTA